MESRILDPAKFSKRVILCVALHWMVLIIVNLRIVLRRDAGSH